MTDTETRSAIEPDQLLSLRNILVPTDFSECSELALGHALEIAARYDAQVRLFHCVDPTPYNLGAPDATQAACDAAWRDMRQLDSDLHRKGLAKKVEIKLHIEAGDLAAILPQISRDLAVDLIVVGTHGRTGWQKLVLGSVAEIVVRQASCPVLTVGPSDKGSLPRQFGPKSILLANDRSNPSKQAESYAFSLARKWGSRLTALRVVEEQSGQILAEVSQVEWRGFEFKDVILEKGLTNPQLTSGIGTRSGLILRLADQAAADLIVLPVKDAYRFADRIRSSYGYQVVCGASCPVLTVPSE